MIGSRVKHAKGIGTVTGVGAKGVTVDGEHKIPHGEYQQHEEEHDLPVLAEAYAKWRRRLPEHLAQGPRSKMGVTAALAATLDQHLAGQMDFDELTLHRLQAVIKALKANKGPHLFSVPGSDGTPVEVGDADVETYLQGFGLSRRGLEAYHANRSVHDEHAKTGDVAKAQKAAAARVNVRNPETLVDPRLGPALEARQKRPQAMDAHADGHRRFAAFTKQMAGGAGAEDAPDHDSEEDHDPAMTKARPGLVLSASKTDPSVKRWQKVEQAAAAARPDDAASVAKLHEALVRHDPHVAQAAIKHSLHAMGEGEHPDSQPTPASYVVPAAAKRQASMIAKDPAGWHEVLTGAVRHREAAERTAATWRGEHAATATAAEKDAQYERSAAETPDKAGRHGGHVWMYHGTTDKFLDTIRRDGLTAGHVPSNFGSKSSPNKRQQHVYLTTNAGSGPASASEYARGAAQRHGGNPVVLRVRVPASRLTHDADDADLSVGAHQRRASHVEPHEIMEVNGDRTEHGLRLHGEEMAKAGEVEAPQYLTKAGAMRFYIRMRMAPTTELLKRALRVDVEPAKDGVTLTCEGRRWTLKPLAKGGAYLRCGDGLPIPLHVICRDLDDARAVVESTTKRLGEGKAPPRGVFRLDDVEMAKAEPVTEVTTTPVRYVVKGVGMVETLERRWPNGTHKVLNGDGRWLPAGHANLFTMKDPAGNTRSGQKVKGTYSADVRCDARCTHAKGHLCTCSCGGKNHGSGSAKPIY